MQERSEAVMDLLVAVGRLADGEVKAEEENSEFTGRKSSYRKRPVCPDSSSARNYRRVPSAPDSHVTER
jgi:hypothetical protein